MDVIEKDFILLGNDKVKKDTGEVIKSLRATPPLLYVSGPMYSEGWLPENINTAVWASERAYNMGWAPIIPHLDILAQFITCRKDRDRYMDVDLALVKASSALLVLRYTKELDDKGQITGTAEELDFAEDCGIPVYTLDTLPYVN